MDHLIQTIRNIPHPGETLSAASALIWAVAVILYRVCGRTVHPLALSFFKNILAAVLLVLTLGALGLPLLPPLPVRHYALMTLSGIIGNGTTGTVRITKSDAGTLTPEVIHSFAHSLIHN